MPWEDRGVIYAVRAYAPAESVNSLGQESNSQAVKEAASRPSGTMRNLLFFLLSVSQCSLCLCLCTLSSSICSYQCDIDDWTCVCVLWLKTQCAQQESSSRQTGQFCSSYPAVLHGYDWVHWVTKSCTATAYR